MTEQEIRAKALEISAAILGPAYKYGLGEKTAEEVILNKYRPLSTLIETHIREAPSRQSE
jgi:hypothetical protein